MNPVAQEFAERAEDDFATASRELAAVGRPNHGAVCFHAQQCVEKLMKAVIIARGGEPEKTHNLLRLRDHIARLGQPLEHDEDDLILLNPAAVDYRYPGAFADARDARDALAACQRLREALQPILGVP